MGETRNSVEAKREAAIAAVVDLLVATAASSAVDRFERVQRLSTIGRALERTRPKTLDDLEKAEAAGRPEGVWPVDPLDALDRQDAAIDQAFGVVRPGQINLLRNNIAMAPGAYNWAAGAGAAAPYEGDPHRGMRNLLADENARKERATAEEDSRKERDAARDARDAEESKARKASSEVFELQSLLSIEQIATDEETLAAVQARKKAICQNMASSSTEGKTDDHADDEKLPVALPDVPRGHPADDGGRTRPDEDPGIRGDAVGGGGHPFLARACHESDVDA